MLTPSGILGLMSCKMRWLQLTCTDAHTSLPHPLPALPPSTPSHPSPDTQLFLFQEAPSLISRPTAGSARNTETLHPHLCFTRAPWVVRNGGLGSTLLLQVSSLPPANFPGECGPGGWGDGRRMGARKAGWACGSGLVYLPRHLL